MFASESLGCVRLWVGGGGCLPLGSGVYNPPLRQTLPEMATAADGTHPTGMHSC